MALSRLCRKPISFEPATLSLTDSLLSVKGKHGELKIDINKHVNVDLDLENKTVQFLPINSTDKFSVAISGTTTALCKNMLHGVESLHERILLIHGVGYRAAVNGNTLELQLGYSHPVKMEIPEGINVSVDKSSITLKGIDKQLVGQFAANIRMKRKVEPYKGKGIRYSDEVVIRKEGKKK